MELLQEEIKELKDLSQEQKNDLAKKIASDFQQWDEDRVEQVNTAKEIMREVYLQQSNKKKSKGMEWQSNVRLNGLYNIKRAVKAMMWREMWSNPAQMFDVRGTNEETQKTAKLQKANLVDSLRKKDVGTSTAHYIGVFCFMLQVK